MEDIHQQHYICLTTSDHLSVIVVVIYVILSILSVIYYYISPLLGRTWGCIEAYTSLQGLPQLIQAMLVKYPDHAFHTSELTVKQKCLALRAMAQDGDALATEIFDFQAKALGLHMASILLLIDAEYGVIGACVLVQYLT